MSDPGAAKTQPQPQLVTGLLVYETALWLRVVAIVLGMALMIVLKTAEGVVKTQKIVMLVELVASLVMTAAVAMFLQVKTRARPLIMAALVCHVVALVGLAGYVYYQLAVTIETRAEAMFVMSRLRLCDVLQYGGVVVAVILTLFAVSTLARELGHEMFGDKAKGLVKAVVFFGVVLLAFWWWTRPRENYYDNPSLTALYGATIGLRFVAIIVVSLYVGVLRQIRKLARDPDGGELVPEL